jgi:ABC-type uncharacterized transport system auxiliary subunit
MKLKLLFLLILIIIAAGCTPHTVNTFILNPEIPEGTIKNRKEEVSQQKPCLSINEITGTRILQGTQIVFSTTPYKRGTYRYSEWDTPLLFKIQQIIFHVMLDTNLFSQVKLTTPVGIRAWQLKVDLEDFYHEAITPPGYGQIRLTAYLVAPGNEGGTKRKSFTAKAPVASYDAEGAVKAMNKVLAQVLIELRNWVTENVKTSKDNRCQK